MNRVYKGRRLPKGILIDRDLVYIRIFPHGKLFQQCFGDANLPSNINLAINKLAEYRQAIVHDQFGVAQKAKRIKFEDALELFLIRKPVYKSNSQGLMLFLKGMWFDEITHIKMLGYREFRKAQGISDSTVNRELTALSAMYYCLKELVELKEIEPIKIPEITPCKNVPKFDERLARRKRVLSEDEFKVFMEVATETVKQACLAALNTALRRKDLFALTETNLNKSVGRIEGMQHKTGQMYAVPANNVIMGLLNEKGCVTTNFRREFEASVGRFVEKGYEAFQFRDLRRTALMKVWEQTKDILLCRDLAGHTDVKTTQLYLGIASSDLHKAGKILEEAFTWQEK